MSTGRDGWWAIQRGPLAFAMRLDSEPRRIAGGEVWWTDQDGRWRGLVSGPGRPVGVRDVAHVLRLPSAPLSDEPWVLASADGETPWALVSDVEPQPLTDVTEQDVPWLPTEIAREIIRRAVQSAEGYFLVIDPETLPDAGGGPVRVVSDERVEARRSRLAAENVSESVTPDLLVTGAGDLRWALDARRVHMVVRAEHVSRLPGSEPVVWGLTTITGRVNIVVDPSRLLGGERPALPCWVAGIQTPGAKWAVATAGEWEVVPLDGVVEIDDHRPAPGPPGLIVQRLRHGDDLINVLSLDRLAELARGADAGGEP